MNHRLICWLGLSITFGASMFAGCNYEPPHTGSTSSSGSGQGGAGGSGGGGFGGTTTSSSGQGGTGGLGGAAGAGGQAGAGGSVCIDEQLQDCYGGPPNAAGKGACKYVQQTCKNGQWEECAGFTLPTSEDCTSQTDKNCDNVIGCKGTPIKANVPDGMMLGDDMIFDMVTTPGEDGYDGFTYAVGARNAVISGAKFPTTPSEVLFWRRQRLGGVNDWSNQFTFVPFQGGMSAVYGTGVAYNPKAAEIIIVGVVTNGMLTAVGKPSLALTLTNGFLTVNDINGTAKFIKAIGNPAESGEAVEAHGVAVDSIGNIYVVGNYKGTINFGGLDSPPSDGKDGFVVSYTSTGDFRWQTFFNGPGDQYIEAIRVNENDEIFIAGRLGGTVSFKGGPGSLMPIGGSDVLLAKIEDNELPDKAGSAIWAVRVGGNDNDLFGGLAASKDRVALAGMFRGQLTIGSVNATSADVPPMLDAYVATFTTSGGDPINALPIVSGGMQSINAVAIDSFGDIVIAGAYSSVLPNNAGTLVTSGLTDFDAFVVKIGSDFAPVWAKDFGDILNQVTHAVVIGPTTGHVIIGGGFQGTLVGFNSAPTASNPGFDAFTGELAN